MASFSFDSQEHEQYEPGTHRTLVDVTLLNLASDTIFGPFPGP